MRHHKKRHSTLSETFLFLLIDHHKSRNRCSHVHNALLLLLLLLFFAAKILSFAFGQCTFHEYIRCDEAIQVDGIGVHFSGLHLSHVLQRFGHFTLASVLRATVVCQRVDEYTEQQDAEEFFSCV